MSKISNNITIKKLKNNKPVTQFYLNILKTVYKKDSEMMKLISERERRNKNSIRPSSGSFPSNLVESAILHIRQHGHRMSHANLIQFKNTHNNPELARLINTTIAGKETDEKAQIPESNNITRQTLGQLTTLQNNEIEEQTRRSKESLKSMIAGTLIIGIVTAVLAFTLPFFKSEFRDMAETEINPVSVMTIILVILFVLFILFILFKYI